MGVRILFDPEAGLACLYCSTSEWAFGPVFEGPNEAAAFLRWLRDLTPEQWGAYERVTLIDDGRHDPRTLTERGLADAVTDWRVARAAIRAAE